MAVDRNVATFMKMLDSKSFSPDAFMMEFLLLANTEAKATFVDMVISAIQQSAYLRNRANDDRAIAVYETLLSMGRGVDSAGSNPVD